METRIFPSALAQFGTYNGMRVLVPMPAEIDVIVQEESIMSWRRRVGFLATGLIITATTSLVGQTIAGADTTVVPGIVAVPQTMSYQGYLTNSSGLPITGTLAAEVSLWNSEAAGQSLWQERVLLEVSQGNFSVELGKSNPMSRSLFDGSNRWLQVAIDNEILTPRKQILAVPTAMYAENASLFNGMSTESFYLRSQADDHTKNKIDAYALGGVGAANYLTKPLGDALYVGRNTINTVNSEMIANGSIQREDIGFQLGMGTVTAVNAGLGLSGGGTGTEISLALAAEYLTGQAFDSRFVRKGEINAITSPMIADESVGSSQIRNGSIQPADMGFAIGSIAQIAAGQGLAGGGNAGIVTLSLNSDYQSGVAYDNRFVNPEEDNIITSRMIKDGELTGADIKNYSITQEDMAFDPGDITAIMTMNGLVGGKTSGEVTLQLAPNYVDGSAYDSRFLRRDQAAVTSDMIVDGTIQQRDLSFPAGDITSVQAGPGLRLSGTGQSGDVTVQLDSPYISGESYDSRFVKRTDSGTVTGTMIKDGDVGSMDLANSAVAAQHVQTPMTLNRLNNEGGLFNLVNISSFPASTGLHSKGYMGIKGIGGHTGVYGEGDLYGVYGTGAQTGVYGIGDLYGVYAKARNENNTSAYSLFVEGKARCTNGTWSDLAEYIGQSERVEAGDVVVIDTQKKYAVKKCDKPYDATVAGVVSTNPTIMVGGLVKDGAALALSGIVPVKVSADGAAIQPGDLLTTSSIPGHAMKATDVRTGTIIGKALEPLASGRGVIQVLIQLM
jgi:hypothetical protein